MHRRITTVGLILGLVTVLSCARQPAAPVAPAPASRGSTGGVTAAPVAAPPATTAPAPTTANAPAGAPGAGGPPRRVPLTPEQRAARRDSLTAVRAQTVKEVLAKLAGKEKMRAGDVFASVELLQDTTVEGLLQIMDQNYGRALGVGCTFCHTEGQWDDDKKEEKVSARTMIKLVNQINKGELTHMPPNRQGRTPTISCITCHRGMNRPGAALMP